MIKQLFTLGIALYATSSVYAQDYWQQYFDGEDTLVLSSIMIELDTSVSNVWQIGKPQKLVFDSAATIPNALITDTVATYPPNTSSSVTITITPTNPWWYYGILAFQWTQKLDLEQGKDGGLLEFSFDTGQTWQTAFNNPYVYNFYGFDFNYLDTLGTDTIVFSGTDSVWRDVWLCFDMSYFNGFEELNPLMFRFTLLSDSVDTQQDGWIVDNMLAHITYIHTIEEKAQEEYMKVYPTVTDGRIHIDTKKFMEYHVIEDIQLFNMMGQVVQQFGRRPTRTFIELGDHPNGTYLLRVRTNMRTETFPVVVSK